MLWKIWEKLQLWVYRVFWFKGISPYPARIESWSSCQLCTCHKNLKEVVTERQDSILYFHRLSLEGIFPLRFFSHVCLNFELICTKGIKSWSSRYRVFVLHGSSFILEDSILSLKLFFFLEAISLMWSPLKFPWISESFEALGDHHPAYSKLVLTGLLLIVSSEKIRSLQWSCLNCKDVCSWCSFFFLSFYSFHS